jgi:hypothetical protein
LEKPVLFWDVDIEHELPVVPMREIPHSQSTLVVNEHWISLGMRRLFLLPVNYRAELYAVRNNIIAVGHRSGRVTFFKFDLDSIPQGELSNGGFIMIALFNCA